MTMIRDVDPERQRYHLFSGYILSNEIQTDILSKVRGSFLTWKGDKNTVEKVTPLLPFSGLFQYSLNCSDLSDQNRNYLTKELNLRVEPVQAMENLEQTASESEQDKPAFLRKITEYHDPAPPQKSGFEEMH